VGVSLRLREKQVMQQSGEGSVRHIWLEASSVKSPGQNLLQIVAMNVPAEDRDRDGGGGESCDYS
jgi:hypothetical protein